VDQRRCPDVLDVPSTYESPGHSDVWQRCGLGLRIGYHVHMDQLKVEKLRSQGFSRLEARQIIRYREEQEEEEEERPVSPFRPTGQPSPPKRESSPQQRRAGDSDPPAQWNGSIDRLVRETCLQRGDWVVGLGSDEPDLHCIEQVERRALAGTGAPGSCNTGAKTSTQGALRRAGTRVGGHERGEYFDSLRVDTVKLSADVSTDSVRQLGFDLVQLKGAAGPDMTPTVGVHDGTELEVKPHAPNDNRAVLMVGEGVEVTAVKTCDVPFLSVEFGASWCWNHEPEKLADWVRDLAAFWGIDIEGTLVSRLDLCVDVDERFFRSDIDRFEGQHRGNLEGSVSFSDGSHGFTGLRYQRTADRDLTFRVYDKRAEVDTRDGHTFWDEVWDAHSVGDDSPVWRIEYEAQRGRLRERGIDTWDDLDADSLESFWSYCTSQFARMGRQVWSRTQDASSQDAADRAAVEPQFDPQGLHRQADGCLDSAADGCNTDKVDELERLIEAQEEDVQEELRERLSGET